MWIMLNNAFFSVVQNNDHSNCLLVRARRQGDIERVFGSNRKVERTPGRDYLYRALINRDVVADIIRAHVEDIDYSNFKNSVSDNQLHNAYSQVWHTMSRLQEIPPYGTTPRRLDGRQGDLL